MERQLIHELIWQEQNRDMFYTGREPGADGGRVRVEDKQTMLGSFTQDHLDLLDQL